MGIQRQQIKREQEVTPATFSVTWVPSVATQAKEEKPISPSLLDSHFAPLRFSPEQWLKRDLLRTLSVILLCIGILGGAWVLFR